MTSTVDLTCRLMLENLQRESFVYFARQQSQENGLITDGTEPGCDASIAAVGLGLSNYVIAAERGLLPRLEATRRVLLALRFFHESPQGPEPDATGYKGFYYHFLHIGTGRRAGGCELSTIDTALLIAGVLSAGQYFDGDSDDEREIRSLAEALYRRVDWGWATNGAMSLTHGWTPETGFLTSRWDSGYSEALILYVLALGSTTFPISPAIYEAWSATFETQRIYDEEYIFAGPMFIHQLSHVWIDFEGIEDDANRRFGIDYFENSRRATRVQRKYAIDNPHGFAHYSRYGWGLTASDGPGPEVRVVDGVERTFFGYLARAVPYGPDDGTISPWAVVASLPFAPVEVCETIHHAIETLKRQHREGHGFDASYNPTYRVEEDGGRGWVSPRKLGINDGPIVLMIENYLTGFLWNLMRRCEPIVRGLRRAGFTGGWLEDLDRVAAMRCAKVMVSSVTLPSSCSAAGARDGA